MSNNLNVAAIDYMSLKSQYIVCQQCSLVLHKIQTQLLRRIDLLNLRIKQLEYLLCQQSITYSAGLNPKNVNQHSPSSLPSPLNTMSSFQHLHRNIQDGLNQVSNQNEHSNMNVLKSTQSAANLNIKQKINVQTQQQIVMPQQQPNKAHSSDINTLDLTKDKQRKDELEEYRKYTQHLLKGVIKTPLSNKLYLA